MRTLMINLHLGPRGRRVARNAAITSPAVLAGQAIPAASNRLLIRPGVAGTRHNRNGGASRVMSMVKIRGQDPNGGRRLERPRSVRRRRCNSLLLAAAAA